VIDPHATAENDPISLNEHLLRKPWFQRLESAGRKKCLLVTTRTNLPEARAWLDENLEVMIRKSIPEGIDPPSSLLPRRLDKPVFTKMSQTYADVFKKQFSISSNATVATATNNRPPRKRQATLLDYDSDRSTESHNPTQVPIQSISSNSSSTSTATTMTQNAYATELLSIKHEIAQLKTTLATAMEQILKVVESFHVGPSKSDAMDMDTQHSTPPQALPAPHPRQLDLPAIISELKNEINTIQSEMRILLQHTLPTTSTHHTQAT